MAVMTALAVAGGVSAAASAIKSFSDSNKQRLLGRESLQDALAAMKEAKEKLEINTYDRMSIQKEPYELEKEASLSAGAQATEAGVESERGGAATAGRVLGQQNIAQGEIRTAMGKEMTDLELRKATEQSRLRDIGVQLDLGEVEGQQQMAADAAAAAAAATTQGFESITGAVQQGVANMPLYSKYFDQPSKKQIAKANMENIGQPTLTPSANVGKVLPTGINNAPTGQGQKIFAENRFMQGSDYNEGSKFGQPIKTPNWADAFNYLKYF